MNTRRTTSWIGLGFTMAILMACGGSETASVSEPEVDNGDAGAVMNPVPAHDSGVAVTPVPVDQDSGHIDVADAGGEDAGEGGLLDGGTDGGVGLGAACQNKAQCTNPFPVCFNFNAKGRHCTKTCKKNTDCPAPSPGCSGQGVCKLAP